MGRTIASVLAALAIIAATVWMLPAAPDVSPDAGSPPPPDAVSPGPDGEPGALASPPPPDVEVPRKPHELPEEQESVIQEACKQPIALLIANRTVEQTDEVGVAVKGMGTADAVTFCKGLAGKADAEVLAALDGLVQ